jgi:hypothetical protein
MNRTPDTWIADGYDVKQRGGRMIAYCGPHHTPPHEYPTSCRLQDEENARWIAAAPARIAVLEKALEDLRQAVGGYLHGKDWDHWQECHAARFAALANVQVSQPTNE